jgi:hypothetical protein
MADTGEGRRRHRRGLRDVGLAFDRAGDRSCLGIARHRALQVERHAAGRRRGHRPQRVADEEQHRTEQGDCEGENQPLNRGLARSAAEASEAKLEGDAHDSSSFAELQHSD